MTEIKLRAWYQGKMMPVVADLMKLIDTGMGPKIYFADGLVDKGWIAPSLVKLMLFAGLEDKNKKELCSGDIVDFRNHDYEDWDEPMRNRGVIVFQFGTFKIFVDGKPYRISKDGMSTEHYSLEYFYRFEQHIEIIGNIYENPELIPQSHDK